MKRIRKYILWCFITFVVVYLLTRVIGTAFYNSVDYNVSIIAGLLTVSTIFNVVAFFILLYKINNR